MAEVNREALNRQHNRFLGSILYIVVGTTLLIGLLIGIVISVRILGTSSRNNVESQAPMVLMRPNRLKTWFRRKFLLPALFGRKHIQPIGYYLLPTRGQSLMIGGYLLLNVLFLATDYTIDGRTVRAVGDRAGHLAICQMPIFFLFAGRNNFLIWISGWPYSDFQVFHKWIARVATMQAIVHSACYGYFNAQSQQKMNARQVIVRFNGIAATAVMTVMILLSVMTIRRKWYELFLMMHILGAILFLAFLYHHVSYSTHPYTIYIWTCAAIWVLDRGLRVIRLFIFNFQGRHTAKVQLIGASTLRLTVYPAIKDIGFAPGAHYFIYIPDRWSFWESHPFTAASWRPAGPSSAQAPEKVIVALQKTSPGSPQTSSDEEGGKRSRPKPHQFGRRKDIIITTSSQRVPQKAKLTFLIHARRGMTRSLLARIPAGSSIEVPCVLEGPYGIARPVNAFPTVVVIAGGVGVSTALPYLQQHLSTALTITRRFVLIWSVREGAMAEKVLKGVKGLGFRPDVAVRVFITRSEPKDSWRLPIGVKVRYRRPKIEETIVREAKGRLHGTPMAVIACGGAGVVDCARKGVVEALEDAAGRRGTGEILYWEEGYGW